MWECVHCMKDILPDQECWVIGRHVLRRGEKSGQLYTEALGDPNKPEMIHAHCASRYTNPIENDSVYNGLFEEMRLCVRDQEYGTIHDEVMEDLRQAGRLLPDPRDAFPGDR